MKQTTKVRCLSLALAVGVLALLGTSAAVAQTHTTGLSVTKTCPDPTTPVAQGDPFQCTFQVTNSGDTAHGVNNLTFTNTYPWVSAGNPGNGPTVAVQCLQGGVPVTALGAAGTATASCSGTVMETAPNDCNPADRQVNDRIAVTGTDADTTPGGFGGSPVSGSATNGPIVSGQDCNGGEFCRTPGFWSTHTADSESGKACAQNVTQAVLDEGGPLLICGEVICNTLVDDASSAVEAMCVAVKGQAERQLARQLTAAGLNCIVTTGSALCDGVSIDEAFDNCNLMCDTDATNDPDGYTVAGCIAEIDCFNNGGTFDDTTGFCGTGTCSNAPTELCNAGDLSNCPPGIGVECVPIPDNCHDAEFSDFENVTLPNDELASTDPCFEKVGPADSSACKGAKKTACTVIAPGEAECDTADACVILK